MSIERVRNKLFKLQNDNTVKINEIIRELDSLKKWQQETEGKFQMMYKLVLGGMGFLTVAIPLITASVDHLKVDPHEKIIIEQLTPVK